MYRIVLEMNGKAIATTDIFETDEIRALNKGREWTDDVKSILKKTIGPRCFETVSSTIVTRWSYVTEQLPIFAEHVA